MLKEKIRYEREKENNPLNSIAKEIISGEKRNERKGLERYD